MNCKTCHSIYTQAANEIKTLEDKLFGAVEALIVGLDFVEQCKDQNTILPAEVDSFVEKAIAALAHIKDEG